MLTETFVAATDSPEQTNARSTLGVHFHEFQPQAALRFSFKKSVSNVFTAQSTKAVINVYNRERNSQEAVIPLPEKITSIVLAGDQSGAGVLIIGTEEGRLILWEVGWIQRKQACQRMYAKVSSSVPVGRSSHRNITCGQSTVLLLIQLPISFSPVLKMQPYTYGHYQLCCPFPLL